MSTQETLGQYITRMREATGKSMRELSRELEISFSVVHAWENDKYQPARHLEALAVALDIHPSDIRARLKDKRKPKDDHPYRNYKDQVPARAATVRPYQAEHPVQTPESTGVRSTNLSDLNIRRAKRMLLERTRIVRDMLKLTRAYGDERATALAEILEGHNDAIEDVANRLLEGEPLGE